MADPSSHDSKVTVSAQEQPEVKEEAPLSPSAHPEAHNHLSQASSPFLGKEIGQIITNFCEGDVEIEEEEQRESFLKEEVVIIPQIQVERKLSDVSCPSSLMYRKECSPMSSKILFQPC